MPMTLAEIDRLLAAGAIAQAREALDALLAHAPRDRHALMRAIDVHAAMQAHDRALTRAHELHAIDTRDLEARFYLAKAEFSAGNLERAQELLHALASTAANQSAAFQFLRGSVCAAQQQFAEAETAFRAAVAIDAQYGEAWENLGHVRRQRGDADQARVALTQAVRLVPQSKSAWTALAHLHHAAGAMAEAQSCFERALTLDANVAGTWMALGNLLVETFEFAKAKLSFERVLSLQPDHDDARSVLGFVLTELGDVSAAEAVLRVDNAGGALPSLSRRVRGALLLPQIYKNLDDLNNWRARYTQGLEQLPAAAVNPGDVFALAQTNFLLAYQGENDLVLQSRYADFVRGMIAKARPDLLAPLTLAPSKRIKIGFVSSFFRECTVGHYFRSWITALDAGKFERIVMHTGATRDAFTAALEQQCDQFHALRGSVLQVAEAIRATNVDVLIYPEIGMGAQNYLLANMRLAPIQLAAWGHPVTTGCSEIDYYLSCGDMEPANAAAHYRERLLLLPGIGTAYALPATPTKFSRAQWNLREDDHVYICPQSLFKVHPDNDAIFCDLIANDPRAVLLFFQANHAAVTDQFSQRLSQAMRARDLPAKNQVKFLPRMDAAAFRATLALADVVLDTLHWSGGNTSLDALAVGAPIVTLPGEFMRGRQTAAMLRALNAEDGVARDHADYVARALAMARDGAHRAQIRERFAAHRGALFARAEPVAALGEYLERLGRGGKV
jgi:protein O-GlcNAc transferase